MPQSPVHPREGTGRLRVMLFPMNKMTGPCLRVSKTHPGRQRHPETSPKRIHPKASVRNLTTPAGRGPALQNLSLSSAEDMPFFPPGSDSKFRTLVLARVCAEKRRISSRPGRFFEDPHVLRELLG